jgi:nitrogen fixation-related uncharacterized protein
MLDHHLRKEFDDEAEVDEDSLADAADEAEYYKKHPDEL